MRRHLLLSLALISCAPETTTRGTVGGGGGGSTTTTQQPLSVFRPIVGGHLVVTGDRAEALVVDSDLERVRLLDVWTGAVKAEATFPAGSWPTRAIEAGPRRFHVLLRGTGELATVDLTGREAQVTRTEVCPEPRGLTLEGTTPLVACASGALVRVAAEKTVTQLPVEWRDIVTTPSGLVGTSFRSAELVSLPTSGALTRQAMPKQRVTTSLSNPAMHVGQVAWRLLQTNDRDLLVLHQLHADQLTVSVDPMINPTQPNPTPTPTSSPYGGGVPSPTSGGGTPCSESVVVSAITRVGASGTVTVRTPDVLPVDAALSPDGTMVAVAGAGGTGLSIYPVAFLRTSGAPCMAPTGGIGGLSLTSVAWVSDTRLLVLEAQSGQPLSFDLATGSSSPIGARDTRRNTSHALFHQAPAGGAPLACASCHPEGGEDGHVWIINGSPRRTQTLVGGVMARAPFHWEGDLPQLGDLMGDTFVKRMGAAPIDPAQTLDLGRWLDTIPAPKPARTLSTDERDLGLAAFQKAGCATCHVSNGLGEGPMADIGTGLSVRTPNLKAVSARAPYLHTGELPDLRTRVMGGLHPAHGSLGRLNEAEKSSLLGYLEAL